MKKIILPILVIGLLMNTVPAIMGEKTEAVDKPKENTDKLPFDVEELVKLIDIDELTARMESGDYAENEVVMVIDIGPSQQKSLGVQQITITGDGELLLNPQPVGLRYFYRFSRSIIFLCPVGVGCVTRARGIFVFSNGEILRIYDFSYHRLTTLGMLWFKVYDFQREQDVGNGYGKIKVTTWIQWRNNNNNFAGKSWASIKCYNNGLFERDGGSEYF